MQVEARGAIAGENLKEVIAGGRELALVKQSDRRSRSKEERGDCRWSEIITSEEERSQVQGSNHR